MGALTDDANLVARRIAVFASRLYAAPTYLRTHGLPARPEDLLKHRVLHVRTQTGDPFPWRLASGNRRWEGVPPTAALINSPGALMQLALNGAGITIAHDGFAAPYVKSGSLVQVLPAWYFAPAPMWAVFPGRRLMPARTRVFIDALLEHLGGEECRAAGALLDRMNRTDGAPGPGRASARPPRRAAKATKRRR
jgi:DNA-binding transcriptional LysR family regulator